MIYTPEFFAFQLTFAQRVADRFGLEFAYTVQRYTTIAKGIRGADWEEYRVGLQRADPVQWAYDWYLARRDPDPQPDDQEFYGHVLFGCFYYEVRNDEAGNATIIRPHFIKNDELGRRPLGKERLPARQRELRQMFHHIREHVPLVQTVLGNSWLYNLVAYRRIYPPAFTTNLPATAYEEFQYLALWGQCFDRNWQPKDEITDELLRRVDRLADLAALQSCFPYAVLRPQCAISEFYRFFNTEGVPNEQQ
jgi:hypothetical protein